MWKLLFNASYNHVKEVDRGFSISKEKCNCTLHFSKIIILMKLSHSNCAASTSRGQYTFEIMLNHFPPLAKSKVLFNSSVWRKFTPNPQRKEHTKPFFGGTLQHRHGTHFTAPEGGGKPPVRFVLTEFHFLAQRTQAAVTILVRNPGLGFAE